MREQVEKWATFVMANLLWSAFALAIITIPAATAAVFAVMSLRVRGKPSAFLEDFFGAMRRLWLKASLVGLIDLVVGGFLLLNLWIFQRMGSLDVIGYLARSVTLFLGLALLLMNMYVWSLMVVTDLPLRQLIEASYKLTFMNPLRSCGVLILAAIPIGISLLLPSGIFLLVTVSATILIINMGTWPMIRRHVPEALLTYL